MEQTLTLEQMPRMIELISSKLETIEWLIKQQKPSQQFEETDEILGVEETAEFLGLKKQTIYQKRMSGELPFMKRGKKLYFSKKELTAYLKEGKGMSNREILEEANNFLNH